MAGSGELKIEQVAVSSGNALHLHRLHLNEPYFTTPRKVRSSIKKQLKSIHLYPDDALISDTYARLASHFNVSPDSLLITNGIDCAVDLITSVYDNRQFITFNPGFSGYKHRLLNAGVEHQVRPLSDLSLVDQDTFSPQDFLILTNPGNPCGQLIDEVVLKKVAALNLPCLIDHTYIQYAGIKVKHDVSRKNIYFYSFSKDYALAGLRLGVLIANPGVVDKLKDSGRFYPISRVGLAAINACLGKCGYFNKHIKKTIDNRNYLQPIVKLLGFDSIPSFTNFMTVGSRKIKNLKECLEERGVLTFDAQQMGMPGYVRIAIPKSSMNNKLISALKQVSKQHKLVKGD